MMKPKSLLLLAVLAGLAAVLLVQFELRREKGETVTVFRATADVAAGEPLGPRLERVTLPGGNLFPHLLEEAPTGEMAEFVANTPLRHPVRNGEIVLYRHLEASVDAGIRERIPAGMKAMSLEVDEASAVAFLVEPEDRVDVLAALPSRLELPTGSIDAPGPGSVRTLPGVETRPLLMGVEVLAVGRRHRRGEGTDGRRGGYSTVTLLVTLEEAQKLAYARDVLEAEMTLALRSPAEEAGDAAAAASGISLATPGFDRIGTGR